MHFIQFLIEEMGTFRPAGQPHFWTSILSGRKEDILSHLNVLKDIYATAAGGQGQNPLPPVSVKWDGSMNLHFAHNGEIRYKGGKPIDASTDLSQRKFGDKSQSIIKSFIPLHTSQPLAKNGATLHTDVIRSGEDFSRAATREIKPNAIIYRVNPAEERKHIVAVHGISTSDGQFLPPSPENLEKYADLKHPHIAIVSSWIDPSNKSPTRFPLSQSTRRVDDAIHAINSIDDRDFAAFTEHQQRFKMGAGKGSFLRDWMHSQVYGKTQPRIDDYLDHIRNHRTANLGGRDDAIEHAKMHAESIVRVVRALQQVTPAADFAGQAAHHLINQSVFPADMDHEGLVYEHGGKTWKAVPPSFSRQVINASH